MCLLSAFRLTRVDRWPLRHEFWPVTTRNLVSRGKLRRGRDIGRIGPHVGDQALRPLRPKIYTFVELLRELHGAANAESNLARSLLLKCARRERWGWPALYLLASDVGDAIMRSVQRGQDGLGLLGVVEGDLLALNALQAGAKDVTRLRLGSRLLRQLGVDRPVFNRLEGPDLSLALRNDAQRRGLDSSRGETALDLLPKERADFVADQPVEHPPRLLGVNEIRVNAARAGHGLAHGLWGDLMEDHAMDRFGCRSSRLDEVPGDGLTLAIGVSRQVDLTRLLNALLELLDELRLVPRHEIRRREVGFDVDPKRALRQITNVAHRGLHGVAGAQVLADSPRFGWGLNDDQPAATWPGRGTFRFGLGRRLRRFCRGTPRM